MKKDNILKWRCNTPGLLKEIVNNNPSMSIMRQPLRIFANILGAVAHRASELNDPELNSLMARLSLYEITDPYSKDYDRVKTNQLINMTYNKKP